ncbi:hypothetical protein ACFFJX_08110 [Pseudarcicella hirudinis]|uniref:hypothetical protein n=1 Tax=Pseudarcicella hirudinis TaxID=1079859 RepID=UPI0035EA4083
MRFRKWNPYTGIAEAAKVKQLVDDGIITRASISVRPDESSAYLKTINGKEYVYFARSKARETSLVTLAGNKSCIRLVDENDRESTYFNLSDNLLKQLKQPKKTMLEQLRKLLNLSDSADESAALQSVTALKQEQGYKARFDELVAKNKTDEKAAFAQLCDKAITEKRISATEKETFIALADASGNYELVEKLLAERKAPVSLADVIQPDSQADNDVIKLADEYTRLDKTGQLYALKQSNPERFSKLFSAKFGTKYGA